MPDFGTFNEGSSALYTATLTDETGAVIDGTALDSLTLTVCNTATLAIVNSRAAQNVKNTNGVTVTALGALTWLMAPADMVILNPLLAYEGRTALLVATWASGTKQMTHTFTWTVRNLALFPPA